MTTPMLMSQHLTEETLAAYVDDRLDSDTRELVTNHLASCGECREIVLMTSAFQVEESANVIRGRFGGGSWAAAIGSLAAAAMIVIVVQPNFKILFDKIVEAPAVAWNVTKRAVRPGPDVDDLIAASRTLTTRPSNGRFAGGFAYSKAPSNMRGPGDDIEDFQDVSAKSKLFQIRVDLEEKARDQHMLGLVQLLTAEKGVKDVSAAVASLEAAYEKTSGEEHDSVAIDLAAALIARARWSSDDKKDHDRALFLSNEVLKRRPESPEALWNRAVALEAFDRNAETLKAWDAYLQVDPNSQWADEARQIKARLQSRF